MSALQRLNAGSAVLVLVVGVVSGCSSGLAGAQASASPVETSSAPTESVGNPSPTDERASSVPGPLQHVGVVTEDASSPSRWFLRSFGSRAREIRSSGDPLAARLDFGRLIVASQRESGSTAVELVDTASMDAFDVWSDEIGPVLPEATLDPTGRWLIVTGSRVGEGPDVGVRRVDLTQGTATISTPSARSAYRGPAEWSATGKTVASAACDQVTCDVVVMSLGADRVGSIDGFVPLAIGDTHLLGYRSEDDRALGAVAIDGGDFAPILEDMISAVYDAYETSDGSFLVSGRWEPADAVPAYRIVEYRLLTGEARLVFEHPTDDRVLYEVLRDRHWAVLGPRAGLPSDVSVPTPLDLLDLQTGEYQPSAAVLQ